MHILIIPSERMMTWDSPVGAIFQLDQAKALNKLGHKVTIISPAPLSINSKIKGFLSFNFSHKTKKEENVNGIKILRSASQIFYPARFFGKRYAADFVKKGMQQWYEYIDSDGVPDVVHVHNSWCAGLWAIELKRSGYKGKIVLTEHDSGIGTGYLSKFRMAQTRLAYTICDNVLVVSSYLKNQIAQNFGMSDEQIEVVPNCIDNYLLDFNKEYIAKNKERITITTIGGVIPRKNHEVLIKAFSIVLSKKNHNLKLNIVGDGPLRDNLTKLIKELNCSDSIELLGYKTRKEIMTILMGSDIFVLPSKHETFGVVLIEALAFGLPCIAFKGSGPDDIITPNNGILVEEQSAEQLSDAMLKMIETIGAYNSASIKQDARNRFSDQAVGEQLLKIYSSIS